MRRKPGMLTLRNAAENAGIDLISDGLIAAVLRGDEGAGSHLRAISGDASLVTLAEAGRVHTILVAYVAARRNHYSVSRELDDFLGETAPPARRRP